MATVPVQEPTSQDTIAEARAEVERLYKLECTWTESYLSASGKLVELEASAGASVLDGIDPSRLAGRIGSHHGQLKLAEAAIVEARKRRRAAIPSVWAAEAAVKRAEADELQREVDARQQKTDALLQQVQEWEGCPYVPKPGPWDLQEARERGYPIELITIGEGPAAQVIESYTSPTPKTQLLRNRGIALEAEAQQLEARQVRDGGQIIASSREELLQQLDALGPMQIAPARYTVLAWLDAAEAKEQAYRQKNAHVLSRELCPRTRYHLSWSRGEIDAANSSVRPDQE